MTSELQELLDTINAGEDRITISTNDRTKGIMLLHAYRTASVLSDIINALQNLKRKKIDRLDLSEQKFTDLYDWIEDIQALVNGLPEEVFDEVDF